MSIIGSTFHRLYQGYKHPRCWRCLDAGKHRLTEWCLKVIQHIEITTKRWCIVICHAVMLGAPTKGKTAKGMTLCLHSFTSCILVRGWDPQLEQSVALPSHIGRAFTTNLTPISQHFTQKNRRTPRCQELSRATASILRAGPEKVGRPVGHYTGIRSDSIH